MRQKAFSGGPWEVPAAYSRAVKVGSFIAVAGTTSFDENGEVVGEGNVYEQIKYIFQRIESVLAELGASMGDVVRTRAFMRDISHYTVWARVHREIFEGIDPVATCIGNAMLMDPRLLVEIEVDAVLPD